VAPGRSHLLGNFSMSTVLYPGSFDPIHLGHLDIVEQSAELFGEVVVAVMHNEEKPSGVFTVDERVRLVAESAAEIGLSDHVRVNAHGGLAVDAARVAAADFIVKGLRNAGDFEIEQQMALTNHSVTGIRTVYLPCRMDRGFISSRFVREIARYGGAVQHLVPRPVATALAAMFPPAGSPSTT
jgi:pantetheine-phosphate adenylyltransferase